MTAMAPGAVLALAAAAAPPGQGPDLLQHGDEKEVSGLIRKWIGVFNPQRISINTRLLMRYDPDIAFGLAIRRAPIENLRWTVESKDPLIAAFIENQLRRSYRQLAKGGSLAIPFGFQVLAKEWISKTVTVETENKVDGTVMRKTIANAWIIRRFKTIDSRTVTLLVDQAKDDWGGVRQDLIGAKGPITVGPEKAVLWSHSIENALGRLEGWPLLDQSYEPWWCKQVMNLYANRYFERRADPVPIGMADPRALKDRSGAEIDGFEYMRRVLRDMKNGAFVIIPSERDDKGNPRFDIRYLTDDQRGDMYQGRLEYLGVQELRGLLITDEAGTSQDTGSRARSEEHAETLADTQETTVEDWLTVVNEQVVNPLVLYNWGERALEESGTRITGEGISGSQRDILKQVFLAVLNAEQFTANGQPIPAATRVNMTALAEQLKVPQHTAKELEKLAKAIAARAEIPGPGDDDEGELDIDEKTEKDATNSLEKKGALDRK